MVYIKLVLSWLLAYTDAGGGLAGSAESVISFVQYEMGIMVMPKLSRSLWTVDPARGRDQRNMYSEDNRMVL